MSIRSFKNNSDFLFYTKLARSEEILLDFLVNFYWPINVVDDFTKRPFIKTSIPLLFCDMNLVKRLPPLCNAKRKTIMYINAATLLFGSYSNMRLRIRGLKRYVTFHGLLKKAEYDLVISRFIRIDISQSFKDNI